MLKFIAHFLFLLLLLYHDCASSDKVNFAVKNVSTVNNEYDIEIEVNVDAAFKMYGYLDSDLGMKFTQEFENSSNIQSFNFTYPKLILKEEVIEGEVYNINYFPNHFSIKLRIKPQNLGLPVKATLLSSFAMCSESCFAEEDNLILDLPAIDIEDKSHSILSLQKIISTLLLAFIGGIILNFMPCVLPVVGLKVLNLIEHARQSKKRIRLNIFSMISGIVVTFLIFGVLVLSLKKLGHYVGWGYHFHESGFIIALLFMVSAIIFNLVGFLELRLPSFLVNLAGAEDDSKTIVASFLQGIIITLLATPCTAPFLASSIAYVLAQDSVLLIVATYCTIGLGMSAPFIVFYIAPSWLRHLPKIGKKTNLFKKVVAAVMLITFVWLLYVLYSQTGFIISFITFLSIAAIAVIVLMRIKSIFPSKIRPIVTCIVIILIAVPFVANIVVDKTQAYSIKKADSIWKEFTVAALEDALRQNKKVLVDITADWCINCKFNKKLVFDNKEIISLLHDKDVLLLRADITAKGEYTDKVKAYMHSIGASGIPLDVFYHSDGAYTILPTLLRREHVTSILEK